MNDLVVLHLSDLHISKDGASFSKLLAAMLSDISKQIKNLANKNLVIVITGDIINAGDERALNNAKKFFDRLKEVTQDKVIALYIVPGNHDKKRTAENSFMVPGYRELIDRAKRISDDSTDDGVKKTVFGDEFKKSFWKFHEKTYDESGYTALIEYAYGLFGMPDIGVIAKKTYGVHVLSVGEKRYCFVLLNTAWSCGDKFDARNLLLGKFQLDEIIKEYHELTDEAAVSMTFVMGHHPIESLHGVEQDALFSTLISYTEISANVYMCGHTHDRSVVNWTNSRHTIHTLSTGFGWPEHLTHRVHDHYYSMYVFSLALNSLDIYVRKTNDGSDFIPDLSIYTGSQSNSSAKLVRPIKYQEAQGAIHLSTVTDLPASTTYASSDFLAAAKRYHERLNQVALEIGLYLDACKRDFLENAFVVGETSEERASNKGVLGSYFSSEEGNYLTEDQQRVVNSYMKKNKDRIYDNFQGYVQHLCQRLREELVEPSESDKIVRFHFRYLDVSTMSYATLCTSFASDEAYLLNENQPSDIKYGDLIEAAFKSDLTGCLVYSINKNMCKGKLKEKWKDFITVVPKLGRNTYTRKQNQYNTIQGPYITFGVTTNSLDERRLLYCMDYFRIDVFLSRCIERYLDTFQMEMGGFVNWVRKETKESASA